MYGSDQRHCWVQAGIATMSVRMGAHQIFWTCIVLLEFAYAGAVVVGVLSPVSRVVMRRTVWL